MRYWLVFLMVLGAAVTIDRGDTPLGVSVRKRLGLEVIEAPQPHPAATACTPGGEIAGTIRNDGDGWYVLDDEDHAPINIAGVETALQSVTIRFAFTGKTVRTLVAAPDEVLARAGYAIGAGVGLSDAQLVFSRAGWFGAHQVSPTVVTTKSYPLSNIWIYGKIEGDC